MKLTEFRSALEQVGLPNAVAGLGILFIVALPATVTFALSAGRTAAESVQITYQLALVLAGLIGLPLAVWRSWTAHRQAVTGMEQLKGLQRQIALAEAGADADRLQKGAEMLQAEGGAVRIAGIAILREISLNANHRYTQEAFAVLASFGRSVSEQETKKRSPSGASSEYLVESFLAVSSSLKLHKREIGQVIIRGAKISSIEIDDNRYASCEFEDSSFERSSISDVSNTEFRECKFFGTKFEFNYLGTQKYIDCSFYYCTFNGSIDPANMINCRFRRIRVGEEFEVVGEDTSVWGEIARNSHKASEVRVSQ